MRLVTVCSHEENFIFYLRVMVYSLRSSGFDKNKTPLYIICNYISDDDKTFLRKLWNVKFIIVSCETYTDRGKQSPKFWALETFNPKHYKIREDAIFLDADTVITQDITGLEKYCKSGISMYRERGRPCFNSGVMCINKNMITQGNYTDMLNFNVDPNEFGHDQQIYNKYFHNRISGLPKKYNMLNGAQDEFDNPKDACIVHYIHKPDRNVASGLCGEKYMNIWNDNYYGMLSKGHDDFKIWEKYIGKS